MDQAPGSIKNSGIRVGQNEWRSFNIGSKFSPERHFLHAQISQIDQKCGWPTHRYPTISGIGSAHFYKKMGWSFFRLSVNLSENLECFKMRKWARPGPDELAHHCILQIQMADVDLADRS
jgi:hypothetical protein